MSLEKRGDFQEGKSYTDDGSGEKAKVSPKSIFELIIGSVNKNSKKIEKEGSTQASVDIDDFLEELEDGIKK